MTTAKQIFSTLDSDGKLQLSLQEVDVPQPAEGQVLIKILASPINPSDMNAMFAMSDLDQAQLSKDGKTLTAQVAERIPPRFKARLGQSLAVGNEGAGEVIAVGAGAGAEELLGKTVSFLAGACYAEYICVAMESCLVHEEGTTASQAASSFVNPLTALCMVETMRNEEHEAMIHIAAASNLGQMLNRICLADNIPLVNIVRKQEHVDLLKSQGAKNVINSTSESFKSDLYAAIADTKATLVFDPTGGGQMAGNILSVMESYFSREAKGLNSYGSEVFKQVYIYGGLDLSPTQLKRDFGMCWSIGGWLLTYTMKRLEEGKTSALQRRVAKEINTTFASRFTKELSLKEVLLPSEISQYFAKRTGEKYLVTPHKK